MHVETVRRSARLPVVAKLGEHCLIDHMVHIRIFEDNEGCVAAEFEQKANEALRRTLGE